MSNSRQKQKVALVRDSADLLTRVMGYENAEVVESFKDPQKLGLAHEAATQLFEDVKRFLYICGTRTASFSPTPEIDKGWHEFGNWMKDYENFCFDFFGRMIYHQPKSYFKPGTKGQTWATVEVAKSIFGTLSANWTVPENMKVPANAELGLDGMDIDTCGDSCGCTSPCADD